MIEYILCLYYRVLIFFAKGRYNALKEEQMRLKNELDKEC